VDGGGGSRIIIAASSPAGFAAGGTESGSRERWANYYLYPLAERTTIATCKPSK